MISLFEKELMRMEQEVRDLKTCHNRGIGTTRFYVYERQIDVPNDYYWVFFEATVDDANLMPMVLMPFIEGQAIQNFDIQFTANGFFVRALAINNTVTIRVLTSQTVSNIQMRIEPWQ